MVVYDGPGTTEASQLAQTRNLIAYDNQKIVIKRPGDIVLRPDKSIERTDPAITLDPQTLYFGGVTTDDRRMVNWQGVQVLSDWVLVGMPDADIKESDTFAMWGRKFVVVEMHPDLRWQKKAWCLARG